MYFVDVPDYRDPEGSWINLEVFDTREEAAEYVSRVLGGQKGSISLISYLSDEVDMANAIKV
jgi:hypothetical protein